MRRYHKRSGRGHYRSLYFNALLATKPEIEVLEKLVSEIPKENAEQYCLNKYCELTGRSASAVEESLALSEDVTGIDVYFYSHTVNIRMGVYHMKETEFNRRDYIDFDLQASLGPINEGMFSEQRKDYLCKLRNAWIGREDYSIDKEWNELQAKIDYVKEALVSGVEIRIWTSDTADDICAFLFLISQLHGLKGTLKVIDFHSIYERTQGGRWKWQSVGEDDIPKYIQYERTLTLKERRVIEKMYKEISSRSGELRMNINGRIVDVPANHFDDYFEGAIPKGTFNARHAMAGILKTIHFDLNYSFMESRLAHILFDSGRYIIVNKNIEDLIPDVLPFEEFYFKRLK